jgi:hypothetical protein
MSLTDARNIAAQKRSCFGNKPRRENTNLKSARPELEKYKTIQRVIDSFRSDRGGEPSPSTESGFFTYIQKYLKFYAKATNRKHVTPDQIIADRKKDLKSDDDDIRRKHEELVKQWMNVLRQEKVPSGKKSSTGKVALALVHVKAFYKSNYRKLEEVPTPAITVETQYKVPITKEEWQLVLDGCDQMHNKRLRTWILCDKECGMSPAELLAITGKELSERFGTVNEQLRNGQIPVHIRIIRSKTKAHGLGFYDSVPGYSPIIINYNGLIDIVSFDDLWNMFPFSPHYQVSQTEEVKKPKNLCTMRPEWTNGWVKVNAIVRHSFDGNLVRINSVGGLVDTSPNHSIMSGNKGNNPHVLRAQDIKIGDLISIRSLIVNNQPYKQHFIGSRELAWLYGFFTAEGSTNAYDAVSKGNNKSYPCKSYPIIFSNTNDTLLDRARETIRNELHGIPSITVSDDGCKQLRWYNKALSSIFRKMFYTCQGDKRVPAEILNAPISVQDSFLDGFLAGDGSKATNGSRFDKFTVSSQTLTAGLMFLLKKTHRAKLFRVYLREDKPKCTQVYWPINIDAPAFKDEPLGEVRKVLSIPYHGHLYDVSTDSGTFTTGIGPVRVHNTFLANEGVDALNEFLPARPRKFFPVGDRQLETDFNKLTGIINKNLLELQRKGENVSLWQNFTPKSCRKFFSGSVKMAQLKNPEWRMGGDAFAEYFMGHSISRQEGAYIVERLRDRPEELAKVYMEIYPALKVLS